MRHLTHTGQTTTTTTIGKNAKLGHHHGASTYHDSGLDFTAISQGTIDTA